MISNLKMLLPTTKNSKGFTLIELLVAVSIITILTTSMIIGSVNVLRRARDTKRIQDMKAIRDTLELYYVDNGSYPGNANESIVNTGVIIGDGSPFDAILLQYMDSLPQDPLFNGNTGDNDYYYAYDPQHFQSKDKGCSDQAGHPLAPDPPSNCDCTETVSGTVAIALLGFNRSESPATKLRKDTCAGTNKNMDKAHYNISLQPMPD